MTSSAASTLHCAGNLNISGSSGALALDSQSANPLHAAIEVYGALTISGSADVNATFVGSGTSPAAAVIYAANGAIISGSSNVTATATGAEASGIWVESGDITISTSGTSQDHHFKWWFDDSPIRAER